MGVWTDHSDLREPGFVPIKRQHAVVRQQDDRFFGEAPGQLAVARRVEVDVRRRLALEGVVIEKSQLLLLGKRAQDRAVDVGLIEDSRTDAISKGLQVGVAGRQFDVDSGLERKRRRLAAVGSNGVHHLEEGHGEVVCDHHAVESELLAKQPGEIVGVGRHRDAVDIRVRVHHRFRASVKDRHLEWRQEDIRYLTRAGLHRRVVASGPRCGVAEEVLQRGVHAGTLEAPNIRGANGTDEIRVLTDALVHPPPARVANNIENGSEPLVDAELLHGLADHAGHLLDQLWVERGTPRQRCGEGGGLPCGEPGQTFLVHECRDAQPGLPLESPLLVPQPRGPVHRIDGSRAVNTGVLSDAMARHFGKVA